ncbi:MAG: dihydroorotate dehydrogenase, partial [Nitrospirota bacterium]|nr:dihydroorotate dehydrogenase [Nitrospirota bacterium]
IENFIKEKLPLLRQLGTTVIVNFFGDSVDEFAAAAGRLSNVEGIHGLEMNISCPNRETSWYIFGTDPRITFKVVSAVRKATGLTLIVKLSPNVTDIALMAKVAEDAGADAVSLINTITGMAIDIETRKPKLANITGGLSGPAIKPIAVRMVWEASKAVKIPVIGIGGIINAEDAIEFILAGATAIEVGTANFINPKATTEIIEGIEAYLRKSGMNNLKDLIGGMRQDI